MKIFLIIIFIGCYSASECWAQEMLGISNSNFAGQAGIYLNPSSIAMAPFKSEFHLFSLNAFADNNYVYIKRQSGVIVNTLTGEGFSKEQTADYYDQKLKHGYAGGHFTGPAFIKVTSKYSLGGHLSWRSGNSATDVPYHLAKFFYEGFHYSPQHNIPYTAGRWLAAASGWFEGAATGALLLTRDVKSKDVWKAGLTAAFTMGSYGIYINSKTIDYIVPRHDLLIVNNWDVEYGHTDPNNRQEIFNQMFKLKGYGLRGSAGLTYIRQINRAAYDCYPAADGLKKYQYRIGLSFLDFGYFNNQGKRTKVLRIENRPAYWPGIDTVKFLSWFYVDTITSNRFYGRPYASVVKREFIMFTPAAVSLQVDYCLKPSWYVNITMIHSLVFHHKVPRRPVQVALTPRYETRQWEIAMPLILFEFKNPALGLALRKGHFFIGTDRLAFFTGLFNSTGVDLFFGLKWQYCGKEFSRKRIRGLCPV
jgi:hypothetical protein